MRVQPYLCFEGACEEALAFYGKAIGAKVTFSMRNKETPDPAMCRPGTEEKIMHAEFQVGDSALMASDGMCTGKPNFQGITLNLEPKTDAEAKRLFDALGDGGKVVMPLDKTFFSSSFGMVTDRFGVGWMIYVPLPM